jgi:enoyl-CoA hydratase/carnithine racemase
MTTVLVDQLAPGITRVTLNRPDRLNALNRDLVAELGAALDEIDRDDACRVVVLTGAGRAFCAGLDLNGFGDDERIETAGPIRGVFTRQGEIADLARRLHYLRQPVIAAVNGAAAGGGLALVLASDIRLAAPSAVFAVSFITAGFSACDIGLSWLLPRIVGAGRAHELMLTGRRFGPDEALQAGLLSRVLAGDELLDAAGSIAEQIAGNAPWSVELTKVGMWRALETPSFDVSVEFENRQQVLTAFTEDQSEAVAAFLAKRPPTFGYR